MGTLSNPSIEVNNDAVAIVPNSFKYRKGKGNQNALPQSAGGNSVEMVFTEDAETKKSMASFELRNTKKNQDLIDAWQDNKGNNSILASQEDFILPFSKMAVITDPETATGADGKLEVMFEGSPIA